MSSMCLLIGFVNVSWQKLRQLAATQAPDNETPNATSQRPPLGMSVPVADGALPTEGKAIPAARMKRWSNLSARASWPAARAVRIAFSVSSQYVSIRRVRSQCAAITRNCNQLLSDWRRSRTIGFPEEDCQRACNSRHRVRDRLELGVR